MEEELTIAREELSQLKENKVKISEVERALKE